ncbi:MAG TPA: N-acetyltransferase [Cytophagales bacterium]|jgi:GNAT superfamily N-acetyltransferase|nr:N-acetyltransferase [Cytophagales bacterium]
MQITVVDDRDTINSFHEVNKLVYANDPNFVMPLRQEIEDIFNPKANPFFEHGKAIRWILKNENEVIGRVAAFINFEKAGGFDVPTGGMGFFECIDDMEAAFLLFDTCEKWLSEQGMEAMEGPINFGENNNYWGLLVEGFIPPSMGMNYNPPYYTRFFQAYGFEEEYSQYTNHFDINKPLPERFRKIVTRVFDNPSNRFEHFKPAEIDRFIDDFVEIYNKAWVHHENFKAIQPEYVRLSFEQMKPIMVPEMIWFAYVDGKPAGFMVSVPDANQIIRHLDGKLNWWSKLKFLWYKWNHAIDRVRVIIMGVCPEYQKKGIESGLIVKAFDKVKEMGGYREAELSWVGSFNPAMMSIHKASGATLGKKHVTMKKYFGDIQLKRNTETAEPSESELVLD